MLKALKLNTQVDKATYKQQITPLKERLSVLQHQVKNSGLPVIILFEGWTAAGKGSVLRDVILTLDPRNFTAKSTLPPTPEEQRKPFLWRHWCSIPEKGQFAIYDKSWYPEVVNGRVAGTLSEKKAQERLHSINLFERQMAEDGALVIKFFLHISKKEQKQRMDALLCKKSTAWRVSKEDYARNKDYDAYYKVYENMLERTDTEYARWHPVAAHDRRATMLDVFTVLVQSIEQALAEKVAKAEAPANACNQPLSSGNFTLLQMPPLNEVFLGQEMEREEYRARLKAGRKKLKKLHSALYLKKIPVVIAYEGWDAAGKGGNIKRLAAALDPRGYEVIPIAAPTAPEKNRQHLWRFWNALPKDGHITMFDRTWYGRVLVERIEGFASEEAWRRSYREINEFESELSKWGAIVVKFWVQIDADEQLRRFESRKLTPEKQWKLTDEDWRNREKWDQYETATNDMIRLTSTDFAPWTIIESQNKRYGRIRAIETLIAAIENHL